MCWPETPVNLVTCKASSELLQATCCNKLMLRRRSRVRKLLFVPSSGLVVLSHGEKTGSYTVGTDKTIKAGQVSRTDVAELF
jgi:hypothetical protein